MENSSNHSTINGVDLACPQHEYGIFGGPAGNHILAPLCELRMPIVTTLHTILRDPDPIQRQVLHTEKGGGAKRVAQRGYGIRCAETPSPVVPIRSFLQFVLAKLHIRGIDPSIGIG